MHTFDQNIAQFSQDVKKVCPIYLTLITERGNISKDTQKIRVEEKELFGKDGCLSERIEREHTKLCSQ